MHPLYHSNSCVKRWGGKPQDYQPIHDWFDATKSHFADARHRALRHHSLGIFQCEEHFGTYVTNSDGKKIPVRLIAEQHIKEDCGGKIPTVADWLENIHPKRWMNRGYDVHKERIRLSSDDHTYEEK